MSELSLLLNADQALRKEVEFLSETFLHKQVSGCNNCYFDAYIELVNLSIEKVIEKIECQFAIRRGKLLRDVVNQDISLNMTQANITNDLALYHLKTNPKCIEFFEMKPDDWEIQVEAYKISRQSFISTKKALPKKLLLRNKSKL